MPYIPVFESVFVGVTTAFSLFYLFQLSCELFFLFHFLSCLLSDQLFLLVVHNFKPKFPLWKFIFAWIFWEISLNQLYVEAICNRKITWKNKTFSLSLGVTFAANHIAGSKEEIFPKEIVITENGI